MRVLKIVSIVALCLVPVPAQAEWVLRVLNTKTRETRLYTPLDDSIFEVPLDPPTKWKCGLYPELNEFRQLVCSHGPATMAVIVPRKDTLSGLGSVFLTSADGERINVTFWWQ